MGWPHRGDAHEGQDLHQRRHLRLLRITDPLEFFRLFRDERTALSRLDDILGSETRNTIAKHELIEVIRTTKDRQPLRAEDLVEADMTGSVGKLLPIRQGQTLLEKEIFDKSKAKLAKSGIELLDLRFKRVNYNESVKERIYERMISERQQIAERFRSEGAGEAAKILGNMEKELREIESGAYKEVETIKGQADAKASEIYAKAFIRDPKPPSSISSTAPWSSIWKCSPATAPSSSPPTATFSNI